MKQLYDLTNPQKSIWLTEQFYNGTSINNICGNVFIKEKVNFDKLKQAINIFVQKNDSMRIKIVSQNGETKQFIADYEAFELTKVDSLSLKDMEKIADEIVSIPFNIIDNFLFKFTLFCLPDGTGRI